ncbi:MAG: PaaI family thioesterase [Deltaproteobacteria bacterium]|nr:PaaI family thioesterase [Deltaproteobacteria bacterium]
MPEGPMIDAELLAKRAAELESLFDSAPIKRTFGMALRFEGTRAIFELPYNPGLDHALGGVHGGVIATMLDNAGWFTAALHYDVWISTVDLHIRLLEPVKGRALQAEGALLKAGKRLALAEMEMRTADEQCILVARGAGTFAITSIRRRG